MAHEVGEFYGIYVDGKMQYDSADSRRDALRVLTQTYPHYAEMIKNLDRGLSVARELQDVLPKWDQVVGKSVSNSGEISDEEYDKTLDKIPTINYSPDYTFSSVRHQLARRMLVQMSLVNSATYEGYGNYNLDRGAIQSNSALIKAGLLGSNTDDLAMSRVGLSDVLISYFEGKIKMNLPPAIQPSLNSA